MIASAEHRRREGRWPRWRLALLLYPFASAAVAINVFMLGLLALVVDAPPLSPVEALVAGAVLGVPAAWLCARWVGRLIDEAEGRRPH